MSRVRLWNPEARDGTDAGAAAAAAADAVYRNNRANSADVASSSSSSQPLRNGTAGAPLPTLDASASASASSSSSTFASDAAVPFARIDVDDAATLDQLFVESGQTLLVEVRRSNGAWPMHEK